MRRYDWDSSSDVGRIAVTAVMEFLRSSASRRYLFPTQDLVRVEDDATFQEQEIDLLWSAVVDGKTDQMSVEVKGDRNDKTGNFFLETISDVARGTPGAFLVSKADWYFYYFVNSAMLYCIPTALTRAWFLENIDRFTERETGSRRHGRRWQTMGRLVPIANLVHEVGCVPCFQRVGVEWQRKEAAEGSPIASSQPER